MFGAIFSFLGGSAFRAIWGEVSNWLNKRQEVLAHNIANSDTPNFQPQELKPLDTRAAVTLMPASISSMTIQEDRHGRAARRSKCSLPHG